MLSAVWRVNAGPLMRLPHNILHNGALHPEYSLYVFVSCNFEQPDQSRGSGGGNGPCLRFWVGLSMSYPILTNRS